LEDVNTVDPTNTNDQPDEANEPIEPVDDHEQPQETEQHEPTEPMAADEPKRDGDDRVDAVQVLPLVALRDTVIFPEMIVPLNVGRDRSVKALDRAVRNGSSIALITQRSTDTEEVNELDELHGIGT